MSAFGFVPSPLRHGWKSAAAIALLLAPAWAAGAAKPPTAPAVAAEVSVTLVEIPVEVVRQGQPVTGLTAADFEVLEGRNRLPIVAFEAIDLGTPEKAGAPPLSLAARRHVLFLFDFAFTQPKRLEEAVAAARELVATGLDPRDLVAVGIYLPTGDLPLLLSFTGDRAAAARTLNALEGLLKGEDPAQGAEESDPLRLTGLGARSLLNQVFRVDERNLARDTIDSLGLAGPSGAAARGSLREGFLQWNALNHSAILHQPNVEARMAGHVEALAEAMGGLAEALRPVSGRKYLTLFSEGFSLSEAQLRPNRNSAAGGGGELLARLRDEMSALKQAGWVLHAVSLGGTRTGRLGADAMFFLANETGGELVEATNQLAEALDGTLERSAHGYLLTVELDEVALDGAYHRVDVRLRDPRRAKVQHRGGYFAPLPFSRQNDVQRLAEAATLVAGEEERDDLGVEVVAVPLRSGAESTPVAILLEVPGAALLAPGAPRIGLEVYGYALDETGNSRDFFAQAVDLDPAKVGGRLAAGGVRVLGKLDLPPGRHRLRVLVRDRGNGRSSLLSLPVSLTAAGTQLDAVFLPPPDDPWVLVRPAQSPFEVHGRAVLPAAHGALAASGAAQVLLLGHGLTAKGAWVRERILTAEGRAATGAKLELLTVTPGEAGEPDLVLGRLRAGSLPPGDYLLELRVGGEAGVPQAVAVRPFRVAAVPAAGT